MKIQIHNNNIDNYWNSDYLYSQTNEEIKRIKG